MSVSAFANTPVLRCHQLHIRLGHHTLIEPFDWQVQAGERWAILGANGVGKTSVLHALLGSNATTNAHIELLGKPLKSLSASEQARARVWTPQRYDEPFTITVQQALRSVVLNNTNISDERIARCLTQFGLAARARVWVHQLSGGERQRLTWAMAQLRITDETALWLLDEPFSAQDIAWQRRLLAKLRTQNETQKDAQNDAKTVANGCAIIASVHDLNQVRAFATHVLLLAQGKVLQQGRVDEVMRSEHLSEAFEVDVHVDEAGWVR